MTDHVLKTINEILVQSGAGIEVIATLNTLFGLRGEPRPSAPAPAAPRLARAVTAKAPKPTLKPSQIRIHKSERMASLVRYFRESVEPTPLKAIVRAVGFDCRFLAGKLRNLGAVAATGHTLNRLYQRTSDFEKIVANLCAPPATYEERKRNLGIQPNTPESQ